MKRKRPYSVFLLLGFAFCTVPGLGPGGFGIAAAQTSSSPADTTGSPGKPLAGTPPIASFVYQARLDTVRQEGFYKIFLQPELVARCRQDLRDLRIGDQEDRFIPYVEKHEEDTGDAQKTYDTIPDPVIRQKDSSNQHSYIRLRYSEHYRIDRLDLVIKGPVFYRREVLVYDDEGAVPLVRFNIDPGKSTFRLPAVKTDRLLLEIINRDDAPLSVKRAATAQLKEYLVAWLQPGAGYRLLAGNTKVAAPQYDLKYFVDSLTKDPPVVRAGPVQPVGIGEGLSITPAVKTLTGRHSGILLWSIIIMVLLLLIFFSFRLIKAIPEKEKKA